MKILLLVAVIFSATVANAAETHKYRVIFAGEDVGHLNVEKDENRIDIDFDYKQNGRGPTISESMTLSERGFPSDWKITGKTTFGSSVDEYFKASDGVATWRDATGPGSAELDGEPRFYVDQNASPYARALMVKALLADEDGRLPVYPAGEASLVERQTLTLSGHHGSKTVTVYEIVGLSYNPQLVMVDQTGEFFGTASPRFSIVHAGFEQHDKQLRKIAEDLSTQRFVDIQSKVAHDYDLPVRIRNVHVFDPHQETRSEPKDVVVYKNRIASVQPANSPQTGPEVIIDGEGGTLVAGLYEMHGHLGQGNALLNIAAGVTSVRDMGNENAVLEDLMDRIDAGVIAGPRITRSCFIEGQSEFASATGQTVGTLEDALAMVRWCGARDFHQVKLYNSMRPEWAETLAAEAHKLGMRVAGHVPAFSSADAMIAAGFDEMTHANQLMLGWVLNDGEDTRTLFRFTAMKRFPDLPLDDPRIEATISEMVKRGVSHDPTLAIHELGLTAVNGVPAPMAKAIIDNLPPNAQRDLKQELFGTESEQERAEYIAAFEFIMAIMRRLNDEGILLIPGTDLGGSFNYHRELELFEQVGMSPAEVLKRASWDMAEYLGQSEDLGAIEKGKYADFFLVPGDPTDDLAELRKIRMVVADGTVYFPSEIHPYFGIKPFAQAPKVQAPDVDNVD